MKYPELAAVACIAGLTLGSMALLARPDAPASQEKQAAEGAAQASGEKPAAAPAAPTYAAGTGVPAALPDGEMGRLVKLGEELVQNTAKHPITKKYVGNALNCTSCHLQNGQTPQSGSFVGLAAAYPAFSKREGGVINLDDRIANCYMRSMNGLRPPVDDRSITAIAAYITWLSEGAPIKMNAEKPLGPNGIPKLPYSEEEAAAKADKAAGEKVYAGKCASCHGADGQGQANFPPVWGERSYNDGAGMYSVHKAASWIKVSMPLGNPNLTEQEALDVAAFINSQPRPKFVMGEHLLPGQKPPLGSMADDENKPSTKPLP